MNKGWLILGILILLLSCQKKRIFENKENSIIFTDEDFKTVNKLKALELNELTDSLLFTASLIVNEDYLFVNEVKTDKYIHVIEIPNNTYIGKFGNKGKGPGEVVTPWRLSRSDKGELRIFDISQRKIVEFKIDSLLNRSGHNREYILPSNVRAVDAVVYDDRLFYLDENNGKHRIYEKGIHNESVIGHGKLPKMESKISDEENLKICSANMSNFKSLFALNYLSVPLIEIYDSELDKWISIIGPENYFPSYKEYTNRTLYNSIKISDNYIYALYNGKEFKGDRYNELARIIYVFTHSGKLVKKLDLDRSIFNFDIYKDKFIYSLTMENGLFKILKFEL